MNKENIKEKTLSYQNEITELTLSLLVLDEEIKSLEADENHVLLVEREALLRKIDRLEGTYSKLKLVSSMGTVKQDTTAEPSAAQLLIADFPTFRTERKDSLKDPVEFMRQFKSHLALKRVPEIEANTLLSLCLNKDDTIWFTRTILEAKLSKNDAEKKFLDHFAPQQSLWMMVRTFMLTRQRQKETLSSYADRITMNFTKCKFVKEELLYEGFLNGLSDESLRDSAISGFRSGTEHSLKKAIEITEAIHQARELNERQMTPIPLDFKPIPNPHTPKKHVPQKSVSPTNSYQRSKSTKREVSAILSDEGRLDKRFELTNIVPMFINNESIDCLVIPGQLFPAFLKLKQRSLVGR